MAETPESERVYIRQAAAQLNRRMGTLRKWEQHKILPKNLMPKRGWRGWRYWTAEQIEGIREWIRETDRRPGKGLPNYNPTEAQLDQVLEKLRKPKKNATSESKN